MLPLEIQQLIVQHAYSQYFVQVLQELQQKVPLTEWQPSHNQTWLWVDDLKQWSRTQVPHEDKRVAYNWVAMDVDWGLWDCGSARDSIAISAQIQQDQECYLFMNACYNKHYNKSYYWRGVTMKELYITTGYSSYFFDKWEEDRWREEEQYEQYYH